MRRKGFNVVDFYELYESSLFVQQVDLRHHHLCPAFRAILFHLGAELCTCTEMGVVWKSTSFWSCHRQSVGGCRNQTRRVYLSPWPRTPSLAIRLPTILFHLVEELLRPGGSSGQRGKGALEKSTVSFYTHAHTPAIQNKNFFKIWWMQCWMFPSHLF